MKLTSIKQLESILKIARTAQRGPWLSSDTNIVAVGKGTQVASVPDPKTAKYLAFIDPTSMTEFINATVDTITVANDLFRLLDKSTSIELSGEQSKALKKLESAIDKWDGI